MSYLDYQHASKGLKAWRNVPEHAQVLDLFFEKLKRERTLEEIAADIRTFYGDARRAA